ncbi:MAG: hypothetical protein KIS96_00310 [Bauldia sp.]|nr:hypothetical protein [Bauldia sp.]
MKSLPARVAERLNLSDEQFTRRRRRERRFYPYAFDEAIRLSSESGESAGILFLASVIRDDLPFMYELLMEVYRSMKSGNIESMQNELSRLRRFGKVGLRGPWNDEFSTKENQMYAVEIPMVVERIVMQATEFSSQSRARRAHAKAVTEQK